jgi:hypothetical protein
MSVSHYSPEDPRSIGPDVALFLQLAVPMLTAGAFFIYRGEAPDLNNPNLPFAFRLLKDVVFTAAVFIPFFLVILTRGVVVPPSVALLLLAPALLAVLMMLIGTAKADASFISLGQLRNIGFYYLASGSIALLAWWRGRSLRLFSLFRLLMTFSVCLGVAFYVFAENLLLYTIHGRMIGTLGNPNFLGFLCFLWLVVLHADIAAKDSLSMRTRAEIVLALFGLFGSASIAAVLSYASWAVIVAMLVSGGALPRSRALRLAAATQAVVLIVFVVVVAVFVARNSDALQFFFRIQSVSSGESETTSIRFADLVTAYGGLINARGILIGQGASLQYVQFDGTNQSLLYNFGIPFFMLWSAFVLSPVFAGIFAWPRWVSARAPEDWLAMMLVPFVFVSFFVEFWIQYVPQMYPTCVIFGLVMYYLLLHSTGRDGYAAPIYIR